MTKALVIMVGVVIVAVVGWQVLESRFAASPYGQELQAMAEVCGAMQQDGKLPGIAAGENKEIMFSSGEVDFSKKDDVRYPLQTECRIEHEGKETAFTFRKETADGSWSFVN